ncbi:MAG: hypothetical protein Q9180_008171 [Flavoplaca navasiana]
MPKSTQSNSGGKSTGKQPKATGKFKVPSITNPDARRNSTETLRNSSAPPEGPQNSRENPKTPPSVAPPTSDAPTGSTPGTATSPQNQTLRQRLQSASSSPLKRKKKSKPKPKDKAKRSSETSEVDNGGSGQHSEGDSQEEEGELTEEQLTLDRLIRWNTFLCHTNKLWEDIVYEAYGPKFNIDTAIGQAARGKVFENTRSYKSRTVKHMKEHVREIFNCDEHRNKKTLYTTRELLTDFFESVFSSGNYFAVFRHIDGYVEYEGSTELGKFYMRSVYCNLAIEVKLYQDILDSNAGGAKDAHDELLKYYDQIPLHEDFVDVDKDDFKELRGRWRNKKGKDVVKDDLLLKKKFVSLGPPPPKKQKRVAKQDTVGGRKEVNGTEVISSGLDDDDEISA